MYLCKRVAMGYTRDSVSRRRERGVCVGGKGAITTGNGPYYKHFVGNFSRMQINYYMAV